MASSTSTLSSPTRSTSLSSSSTGVDIETSNGKRLHFVWSPEVNSTQDAMKALLVSSTGEALSRAGVDVLALGAGMQTKGRGTSGRAWVGIVGNAFLTLALPRSAVSLLPYAITLLPLRIGTLVARAIIHVLPTSEARANVHLKWPNDVLLSDEKVSGLLVEMDSSSAYYLVGIGVNVVQAPPVPAAGADRGRTATCLADHGLPVSDADTAKDLSISIARAVTEWIGQAATEDTAELVVADWEGLATWGKEYRRRDDDVVVTPLGLEMDGRLRVRDQATGAIHYLVAEYLH
ncbi:biotin lipoate protein ligase-like protein [Nannochloropsis oceanica]